MCAFVHVCVYVIVFGGKEGKGCEYIRRIGPVSCSRIV